MEPLDLDDIQGDLLENLQKKFENFIFFKILLPTVFKKLLCRHVIDRITVSRETFEREAAIAYGRQRGGQGSQSFTGLNVGFAQHGLSQLLGLRRPLLARSFEKGADHPETAQALADPPKSRWLPKFTADRIDGVFLVTGPDRLTVKAFSSELTHLLGPSVKVVYSEIGNTRPGANRGYEHFGFRDGVSQPGIRGLTLPADPVRHPDQGLPGQDLLWPGEFVFGYPGQHPEHPTKAGPEPKMAAPWMKNGSYMVFRRLEQKVPEFRRFVSSQAARLGMEPDLLAARMVGRWKSGAPLELAPRHDDTRLGGDPLRNNDFEFGDDPFQRRCPYAAHIRKAYPRDDIAEAEAQRHRILRAGISFGPEVEAGETVTRRSRGLMFVCYQTSIERQFEFIQKDHANNPHFVAGRRRPGSGLPVTPGYDPIIGQAANGAVRVMDEPYPNEPSGNRRSTLDLPRQFVVLTAAGYFFMPSITALRTVLT
jgi:Dyp-type peroxidase family